MGDKVIDERMVDKRTVAGREVEIIQLTWRDAPGRSYDVVDVRTSHNLTEDESFDQAPTNDQIAVLIEQAHENGLLGSTPTYLPF